MKRKFQETVEVDGIEWRVEGCYTAAYPATFYDPGEDLGVEDYAIFLDTVGPAADIDMADVLGDDVHYRIIAQVERSLGDGVGV